MRHEILKKTLLYRVFSFALAMIVSSAVVFLFLYNSLLTWHLTIWTEVAAVSLYYSFEYSWRKYIEKRRIKEGTNLFSIGDSKVKIAYNVIEVLDDNKFIIEVE